MTIAAEQASRHDLPIYLTTSEVAAALRVSTQTVRRLIIAGDLKAVRCGARNLRIDLTELRRFLGISDADRIADDLLDYMARHEADRARGLCPRCATKNVDPTSKQGWCVKCTTEWQIEDDERHEREKARQRRWWTANGQAWREDRRAAAKAAKDQKPC